LAHLIPHLGREEGEDWPSILSLGEKQRVSMVRVLIQQPTIVFLDEITSGLDGDLAIRMYELILNRIPNITIVSINHIDIPQIYHLHKFHLQISDHNNSSFHSSNNFEGRILDWKLETIELQHNNHSKWV